MLADYHMHSHYSNDSKYNMEDAVKKSIEIGLDEICFTEHSDHGSMGDLVVDYQEYYKGYLDLAQKYKDKIIIKFGCEFGVQIHTIDLFEKDFQAYPFDFIILSNHQIDDTEFWTYEYQEGKSQIEYNRGYYQAILDVIQHFDHYSVLGHLDVIKRYDKEGELADSEVMDLIDKILKHIIEHGKGIEVNTSSFRYGLDDLTPSTTIIKRFYELGGRILTIGSDTHEEKHVGHKIAFVKKELKKIGFTQYCTFEKMKPIFHEL